MKSRGKCRGFAFFAGFLILVLQNDQIIVIIYKVCGKSNGEER